MMTETNFVCMIAGLSLGGGFVAGALLATWLLRRAILSAERRILETRQREANAEKMLAEINRRISVQLTPPTARPAEAVTPATPRQTP
jgi:hypothetical protein